MVLAFLFTIAALLAIYVYKFYENVKRYPKGPTPLPLVGNLIGFDWRRAHKEVEKLSKQYGKVFTIWLPRPFVIINDYDGIKEAFAKTDDFSGRPGCFPEDVFQIIKNGGVILSEGNFWANERRISLHILRDFGMGKNIMEEQVTHCLELTHSFMKTYMDDGGIDLHTPIQFFVGNVINKTFYGISYEDSHQLMDYARKLNNTFDSIKSSNLILVNQAFPWVEKLPILGRPARKYRNDFHKLLEHVHRDIKIALDGYQLEDEPTNFVQAYYQKKMATDSFDMDQLINICSDFYMAGMETTSTTLRWGMLFVAENQDIQNKVREEIINVIGFDREPTLSDRPQMPYTQAVIHEIHRYANIIPMNVVHKTLRDTSVANHSIPKDTSVYGQIYDVHNNSEIFDKPEVFNPSRFLMEDGKTLNKELINYVVPFSIGKRQCAGEGLAKMEMFLGFVSFLQKYKCEPLPGRKLDLEPVNNSVLVPKNQKMKVTYVNANK